MHQTSLNDFFFALAGPVVWFLFFSALYSIETLSCTPEVSLSRASYGRATVGAAFVAAVLLAAVGLSQLVSWKRERGFLAGLGLLLTGISAVATIWTALPLWLVRSCGAF